MALVIDASGMVIALTGRTAEAVALRRRLGTEVCHAPHLIDAEVGNVLRRQVVRGDLSAADAQALLRLSWPLVDFRYEMSGSLAGAAWALRHNVTFYDALYAALAAALGLPLVTADARLAKAPGLTCQVEAVGSRP